MDEKDGEPLRLSTRVQGGKKDSIELLKECWNDLDLDVSIVYCILCNEY